MARLQSVGTVLVLHLKTCDKFSELLRLGKLTKAVNLSHGSSINPQVKVGILQATLAWFPPDELGSFVPFINPSPLDYFLPNALGSQ
jgi:hypothetical protein